MAPPRYAPYVPRARPQTRPGVDYGRRYSPAWREPSPNVCSSERATVSLAPFCPAPAQSERLLCWQRVPHSAIAALRSAGVASVEDLVRLSGTEFHGLVAETPPLRSCKPLLECLRREPFDRSLFLQRLMVAPRTDRDISVHDALRLESAMATALPRPRESLRALSNAKREGRDVASILDNVIDQRAGCAIAESTGRTYDSHLNQVREACELLNASVCPASLDTIRRVSAVVNNASTLRGWLAAWRQLHIMARCRWPGDSDPHLLAARAGLSRYRGPAPPRKRMRRHRLLFVVKRCIDHKMFLEGAVAVLAYVFGLRVPSELLRQAQTNMFAIRGNKICYGPIRRKGKQQLSTLKR